MEHLMTIIRISRLSRTPIWLILLLGLFICTTNAQYRPKWPSPIVQREIFLLNLEDGYFGCQVNESTDFLQLFELSQLCDGVPQCFQGSDELSIELKCGDRDHCHPKMPKCLNGVCLDNLCYCNDGFGGRGCDLPDENECKYRPCDVFAHCTNTMGSFYCSCSPGYDGDGFSCHDVNECEIPLLASLCAENSDCYNLPGHFVCKCKEGFTGNATQSCNDIDECLDKSTCGRGAVCQNNPGGFSCHCPPGFTGDPTKECWDVDECRENPCGSGAVCTNLPGEYTCTCPTGYKGNPTPEIGCVDRDECSENESDNKKQICGTNATCVNTVGDYFCQCPQGHTGNPRVSCIDIDECRTKPCGSGAVCTNLPGDYSCSCPTGYKGNPYTICDDINECLLPNVCGIGANCINVAGSYSCECPEGTSGNPTQSCHALKTTTDGTRVSVGGGDGGGDSFRECTDHKECLKGTVCYRGQCSKPNTCTDNSSCGPETQCRLVSDIVGTQCVDPCDLQQCGPNAYCQTIKHLATCRCNDSYTGNPHDIVFGCTPIKTPESDDSVRIQCKHHTDCSAGTVCKLVDEVQICVDICETITCGPNAVCRINDGRPECFCESHMEGKPYDMVKGCYPPACLRDGDCQDDEICELSPQGTRSCASVCTGIVCGSNAICRGKGHKATCRCRPNFKGDPYDSKSGCQPPLPTCVDNNDCPDYRSCERLENGLKNCTDVCQYVRCGLNAHCVGKGHVSVCECQPGFFGDSIHGCRKPPSNLCEKDSDCKVDKTCKLTAEGIKDCVDCCVDHKCPSGATCVAKDHRPTCECLPGYTRTSAGTCQANLCRSDTDCGDNEVCVINRKGILDCINACKGIRCGPNAHCQAKNHQSYCKCNQGFDGNPDDLQRGCPPSDKCKGDSDCLDNEVCRVNQNGVRTCVDGCKVKLCGPNAACSVVNHFATCTCHDGYTGQAENKALGCHAVARVHECSGDEYCPTNAVCVPSSQGINECRDACVNYPCGENADCVATNHKPICTCRSGFMGDPLHKCRIADECKSDEQCPEDSVCKSDTSGAKKCVLACLFAKCAKDATCIGRNHEATCACPQGYSGDPFNLAIGCRPQLSTNVCARDSECNTQSKCRRTDTGNACVDACEGVLCGPNARCESNDHIGKCQCLPEHYGDPDNLLNGCRKKENDECAQDFDCLKSSDVCKPMNIGVRKCFHACKFAACGPNAECRATNHTHFCDCREGFIRESNGFCVRRDDECKEDSHCPSFQTCRPNAIGVFKCVDVCADFTCTANARCVAINHRGQCQCEPGFTGDPQSRQGCIKIPLHECSSEIDCLNPNHACIADRQGLRKCADPCEKAQCGQNAICVNVNRKAQCKCPQGHLHFVGDPYERCERVECLQDDDCPESKACSTQNTCYDPCINGCGLHSICVVQNHKPQCKCSAGYSGDPFSKGCFPINICDYKPCHPSATCIENAGLHTCLCPSNFVGDPYNRNGTGCRHPQACDMANKNADCSKDTICVFESDGVATCKNPCEKVNCGPNAVCAVRNHEAVCVCPENFRTSPDATSGGCVRESRSCSSNPECDELNQACVEGQCRFVCTKDSECAMGEKCLDNFCVKACFVHDSCPPSEACLPRGFCQIGCRDNSECAFNQACVQNRCQNPCEIKGICGANTVCSVSNHNLTCNCVQDFEGNPTPFMGCRRKTFDCKTSRDCPIGYKCSGNRCRADCSHCVEGEVCSGDMCMVSCTTDSNCPVGEICSNRVCQLGCRSDGDCNINQFCSENQCKCINGYTIGPQGGCVDINECLTKPCHKTAICENKPGSYQCSCPEGEIGDGITGCRNAGECPRGDSDCPDNAACKQDENGVTRCVNPCENSYCGPNAQCLVQSHKASCLCPSNVGFYTGDPYNKAEGCRKVDCLNDSDCPNDRQCVNFVCKSACDNVDCGAHGKCIIRDRQAACRCEKGYENQGRLSCVDSDECKLRSCHETAVCENTPGSFSCRCPDGLVGNAYSNPGCHESDVCYGGDSDCPDSASCIPVGGVLKCRDRCNDPTVCGINATCLTLHHRPRCQCPAGFSGDPYNRCERVECTGNQECPSESVCFNNKCIPVCDSTIACGENSICIPLLHSYSCKCKEGFYGDPVAGCRRRIPCEYDENCPSGEFCSYERNKENYCRIACQSNRDCNNNERCENGRCLAICDDNGDCPESYQCTSGKCMPTVLQNRCESDDQCDEHLVCRPNTKGMLSCTNICESILCGRNAVCKVRNHAPVCECMENFTGNPLDERLGCHISVKCRSNDNCTSEQACENYKCVNPCESNINCGRNAACSVQDHIVSCRCKEGFEGDPTTGCVPINYCLKSVCHRSALCTNKIGGFECTCPPERNLGNPYTEPGCQAPNECTTDSNCLLNAVCEYDPKMGVKKCKNPCENPGTCGNNAICEVENRRPVCRCADGFIGNPRDRIRGCVRQVTTCSGFGNECPMGMICENSRCRAPCQLNRECAKGEVCFDGKCTLNCVTDDECSNGEICMVGKCTLGCRNDNQCSLKESCLMNQCKDLCSQAACGTNAICSMVAHSRVCTCPPLFTGDPQTGCSRIVRMCLTQADCPPNHLCQEGRCRADCSLDRDCALGEKCFDGKCVGICREDKDCSANEICLGNRCSVGCRNNNHCSDHLACTNNKCLDPCEGSATCGPNALCHVINHRIACSCPEFFVGRPNANVGCTREASPCKAPTDCRSSEVCSSGICRATCAVDKDCAVNERCLSGACHVNCNRDRDCQSGEICEKNACMVGCRADNDCSLDESCFNNQCIDPCASKTSCGTNAFCRVENHERICSCKNGTAGNPSIECIRESRFCSGDSPCPKNSLCDNGLCRHQCRQDSDCFDDEECTNGFCTVICKTDDSCPKGYVCESGQCRPGCRSDDECPSTDSCINRKCINTCDSPSSCGAHAQCQVINHAARCSCPPKYTGNPRIECKKIDCVVDSDCPNKTICQNYKCLKGCRSDNACSGQESCISLQCTDPCRFSGVCGENALCRVVDHKPQCACENGLAGNPLIRCYAQSDESTSCDADSDCLADQRCISGRCVLTQSECRSDKQCSLGNVCIEGKCFAGCKNDNDCPLDMSCINQQCSNPCSLRKSCGLNAQCSPYNHKPKCSCGPGYTGNPLVTCTEIPICRRSDECPVGYTCSDGRCSIVAGCVSDHECSQGEICEASKCREGCRSHADCDFTSACIGSQCQNPCNSKACGTNAKCYPINHDAVCRCPEGFFGDAERFCSVEKEDCFTDGDCGEGRVCISNRCIIGCASDDNCPSEKACIARKCRDPCAAACGHRALCRAVNHRAECACPPSLIGDPRIQCTDKLATPSMEDGPQCETDISCNPGEICETGKCTSGCRRDSDCTYDKACYNSKCVNPCTVSQACGPNTECHPVVHRPRCSCKARHSGNPYDYCRPSKDLTPIDCSSDGECYPGKICEQNKCTEGCRYDENCPLDKACINRQCLSPCDFPDSCAKEHSTCVAVRHRPICSCAPGYTGDGSTRCYPILLPVCLNDVDCGRGQICENGKCIDACRTDDTCSFTEACINRRCQDPCSVFGACGRNALCRAENHRPICSCPPEYRTIYTSKSQLSSSDQMFCERSDRPQQETCINDRDCEFGSICENGSCIEGCRNDEHCTPDKTCQNRLCKDPCSFPNSCGANSDCLPSSHRPICSCKPGFVGDPYIGCRAVRDEEICNQDSDCGYRLICERKHCIVACRSNEGCAFGEACINRLCQDPCSFFGACGRNADCKAFNHTAICSCFPGYKGNPNLVCTEAEPQCHRDGECVLGEICENNQCIKACRQDNNCPEDRACINGACENPCLLPNACGQNTNCQPFQHRPRCECIPNHRGNPMEKCEPIPDDYCDIDSACPLGKICENNKCIEGCRNDANCKFEESCINKLCQNPCEIFGACGPNSLCKPVNHDRLCTCKPEYTGNAKVLCERIQKPPECLKDDQCPLEHICQNGHCTRGCRTSVNCPSDKACIRGKCSDPCSASGACGRGAICSSANHLSVCSCPSGFRGNPEVECREIAPECRHDTDCGLERICLKQKCTVGCRSHTNCPFDKACVNGQCQSPCSIGGMCGVNTICRAENHEAQCSCSPGYTGDPLKQCSRLIVECEQNSDCGSGYVCANQKCKDINECLQERLPCGPGASCQNLAGWYKCSCPFPLVGNAYSKEGCRPSVPICYQDGDCKGDQKCNPVTQECYDVCSKPGICGKGAICKASKSKAECECLPGYRGNPYVECSIRDSCTNPSDCPGNLLCLGQYCGCPAPYRQFSSFCVLTSMNCSTNNSCASDQNCVYNGKSIGESPGYCVCPKGYLMTLDGTCRDYNECEEKSLFPCGPGAKCMNKQGSYDCRCPSGTQGDPYGSGCVPEPEKKECFRDTDCPSDKNCINFACRDFCSIDNKCGQNAMCFVENHIRKCKCRTGFSGNPMEACRPIIDCVTNSSCPGNLICLDDNRCGCPGGFNRILDYCTARSVNCSTTNPCSDNQECVFSGLDNGFCVCPRGYDLLPNNVCRDINECSERNVCGQNARCVNLPGSYECRCDSGFQGEDPYKDGCRMLSKDQDCTSDNECPQAKKCDYTTGQCYDPCNSRSSLSFKCGSNAVCTTSNHISSCSCPPGFEGNPYKLCTPTHQCGISYHCPGNLVCLNSRTCGCPFNYIRDNDYCLIRSTNCTTTNPCVNTNEECVFTGDRTGFCICPHGYELAPTGECRQIRLCEQENPCAPGAICHDRPGSYSCVCPTETIGDPYVKGCKEVVGCQYDHDCPIDRECDTGSKQCISPCHVCGPNADCVVREHKAICVCGPGKVGKPDDKEIGCFVPPSPTEDPGQTWRTIPPVQDLTVMCLAEGVQVGVRMNGGYEGAIYVKGHSQDPNCRRLVTTQEKENIDFKVLFGQCGLVHVNGEASFILVLQKHPRLVTVRARAYHIKCMYMSGERTVTLGFNVSMITTSGTIANTGPPPTCLMSITTLDGREVSSAEIGDDLLLKVDVQPDFIYGGFARSCVAKTMNDGQDEFQYEVTDSNGCATDPSIFGNWEYDPNQKTLMARFNAFKFPSSNNLRFQCNIRVCFGSCPPVNCDGVEAYGRRRRRRNTRDEDLLLTESYKEGALREEIMVQSNAILTFEKREPQPSSSQEGSRVESNDHVCLPRLGLITSMILTTLLALVAVAVAISCWLIAYRRKPRRSGPLPHPVDFPNPIHTTPEPLAEPSPDYYYGPRL